MEFFPVFLSVVFVLRNQAAQLERLLDEATKSLKVLTSDYELIVVDNASDDDSLAVLKRLTSEGGQPNVQVFGLTKEVDTDTASWVGLENALGDFVAVMDPATPEIDFLPTMLAHAVSGFDVVFASNSQKPRQTFAYECVSSLFNSVYRWLSGVHISRDAPHYRLLSRRVVNFIFQHPQPVITYRHMPATGGFARINVTYTAAVRAAPDHKLGEAFDRGMRLIVSTTRAPMRLVTALSLFGAVANLIYSVYVVAVGFLKPDVAAGWISLSLQQSGMFFLISLVLLVLGEYVLHMAGLSSEGPLYHVGQEFTSACMTRNERLNVEQVGPHLVAASEPTTRRRPHTLA